MLLRQLPSPKPADRLQLVKQSVDLANEAVKVDVKDGLSWYCLGKHTNVRTCKSTILETTRVTACHRKRVPDAVFRERPGAALHAAVQSRVFSRTTRLAGRQHLRGSLRQSRCRPTI